jgi:hypothetical protein
VIRAAVPPMIAAGVAAVLVAGCSGGPPASAPASGGAASSASSASVSPSAAASASRSSRPRVVVPAPPRKAACYRLTSAQLTRPTNDSRPVPCSRAYTARTIHVGRLDTVVAGHSVAVDSDAVQRQLAGTCRRELASYVGGSTTTRRLSRLNVAWFSPTLAQSDRGADWFRCDVVAFSQGDALLDLPPPQRLKGLLSRAGALDDYGLCGTAAPATRGFDRVVCGRPHAWRAISTIELAGGKRYPGAARVRRAGDSGCKDAARSRADDTLKFSYGWEWPTAAQWAAGQHFGYCWAPG